MLKPFTAIFSSFIALSVLLLGVHARDVSAATTQNAQAKKLDDGSGQQVTRTVDKQVSDHLHNHVEKQSFKSMVKTFSDQSPQADHRSLKKQRTHKRPAQKLFRFPMKLIALGLKA